MKTDSDKQWVENLRIELTDRNDLLPDGVDLRLAQIRQQALHGGTVDTKSSGSFAEWLGALLPAWQPRLAGIALAMLGTVLILNITPTNEVIEPAWSEHAELLGDDLSLYLWLTDDDVENGLLGG